MLIKMQRGARSESTQRVINKIIEMKCRYWVNLETEEVIIVLLGGGDAARISGEFFEAMPEVERVIPFPEPYVLSSRQLQKEDSLVQIGGIEFGGNKIIIAAGPCAVESKEQILACAKTVKDCGGQILRGGAFKPRSSPFTFQGMKEEGLKLLFEAGKKEGLLTVTEVIASEDVPLVEQYADILQIGARNMQNSRLLEAVGKSKLPVVLKRGCAASPKEWLAAADYVLIGGNKKVVLCERGSTLFNDMTAGLSTRYTLDLGMIPIIKKFSHLPIIVDPSHAAGRFEYVPALAKAAVAAGADGLLIEIHPNPRGALSDGPQQLTFSDFKRLMQELKKIAAAIGRKI